MTKRSKGAAKTRERSSSVASRVGPVSWVDRDSQMAAVKVQHLESEVEELRASNVEAEKKVFKVRKLIRRRAKDLSTLSQSAATAATMKTEALEQLSATQEQLSGARTRVAELEVQLQERREKSSKSKAKLDELAGKHQRAEDLLQQRTQELKAREAAWHEQATAAAREHEELRRELKTAKKALAHTDEQLKQAVAKPSDAVTDQLSRLNAAVEELTAANENLAEEKAGLQTECDRAKHRLRQVATDGKASKRTLKEAVAAKEELASKVAELGVNLEAATMRLGESQQAIADMEGKLAVSEHASASLQQQLEEARREISDVTARAADEVAGLNERLQNFDAVNMKVRDLEATVKSLKTDIVKIAEEKEKHDDELRIVTESLQEKEDELARKANLADTAAEMYVEATDLAKANKELKRMNEKKDKRIEVLKASVLEKGRQLEVFAEEKADRDARIAELMKGIESSEQAGAGHDDFIQRSKSMTIESPVFAAPPRELARLSPATDETCSLVEVMSAHHSTPGSVAMARSVSGTPNTCAQGTSTPNYNSTRRSLQRVTRPEIADSDYQVTERDQQDPPTTYSIPPTTPETNTAPRVYAQPLTRTDKDKYKAALDLQIAQKKRLTAEAGGSVSKRRGAASQQQQQQQQASADAPEFFKFGVAGSGAPIRDINNDVVTNVTFTRSNSYLPIDHPMSMRKPKKARHF
ncbi:hypothetical protein DIPPA_31719 [Diplonema papillatum]|nr:hypothetical protein DIPPA_31719 [Diplonema papillatum]